MADSNIPRVHTFMPYDGSERNIKCVFVDDRLDVLKDGVEDFMGDTQKLCCYADEYAQPSIKNSEDFFSEFGEPISTSDIRIGMESTMKEDVEDNFLILLNVRLADSWTKEEVAEEIKKFMVKLHNGVRG